jgi:hypothetical protein
MKTIDVRKEHPELYRAGAKVVEVKVARATYLAVDGVGEPGGEGYHDAIDALFGLAYTTKFLLKREGTLDFTVPALECLWLDDPKRKPPAKWRWRLLARIPDALTATLLKRGRAAVAERGGDASAVERIAFAEGRALQVLHVGPYDRIGDAYCKLAAAAEEAGLRAVGPGHEIYLSDPRRTAPARLKTIARLGVKR